jgi:beta-galactosidase
MVLIEKNITVEKITLWSSEYPLAYGVNVELLDDAGKVVEAFRLPLGFRRLEARGNTLYYNNQKLKIRGVNK